MTPTAETRALYESMRTGELIALRRAFELDQDARHTAFGEGRIALIDEILAARKSQHDRETPLHPQR